MLCENCKSNNANTHIRKNVNGKIEEHHLCSECAKMLGYDTLMDSHIPSFGSMFGSLLSIPMQNTLRAAKKCPICHSTFSDITNTGVVGCSECYNTFYEELLPSIRRIHGNTTHMGKRFRVNAVSNNFESNKNETVDELKAQLQKAIDEQEFEKAAMLRDKIKLLSDKTEG